MKRTRRTITSLFMLSLLLLLRPPAALAEEAEPPGEGILRHSGAQDLPQALDEETRESLSRLGVEAVGDQADPAAMLALLSEELRERLSGPLRCTVSLAALVLLLKLGASFGESGAQGMIGLVGGAACAALMVLPLLQVLRAAQNAVENASVFLLAALPVYIALLAASGGAAQGSGYGLLTLAAGNAIPVLADRLLFPLLHLVLALSVAAAVSRGALQAAAKALYGLLRWLLILTVTVFTGLLSVQTAVSGQADAAAGRALKFVASSAVPIVGSAFGDAVSALRSSLLLVRSGAGAFGILAFACMFLPCGLQAALWSLACKGGELLCGLFELPRLGALLGACHGAVRLVLAVIVSACTVCLACCAVLLAARGAP